MKILKLIGRCEEASDYIEFQTVGGIHSESRNYEFYISEDGNNLFVNSNLEEDQINLVLSTLATKKDKEFFIETMARCGYGL